MALQKPIVNAIAAFDATAAQTIPFVVNGGDTVVKNRAIIKLGSTNQTVYDSTQTTTSLQHTIAANTLTNGNYYTIQIQTFNSSDTASTFSSTITFYCYSAPTFSFSNLPTGNVLTNAAYTFNLSYTQSQGEALNTWAIYVYDSLSNLLWSSGTNYAGSNGNPPATFSFSVSGFEDGYTYTVRAYGQTTQGTQLDTGAITLTATFDSPSIYTQFEVENNECDGYMTITSNIISLEGTSNPTPPTYIENQEIDLTASGSYVNWEQSFGVYDTSTLRLWLRKITANSIVATFYNASYPTENITIYEREYTDSGTTYMYIEAYYQDEYGITGYIFSDAIEKPADTQALMIWLQKSEGMYDISIAEVTS